MGVRHQFVVDGWWFVVGSWWLVVKVVGLMAADRGFTTNHQPLTTNQIECSHGEVEKRAGSHLSVLRVNARRGRQPGSYRFAPRAGTWRQARDERRGADRRCRGRAA